MNPQLTEDGGRKILHQDYRKQEVEGFNAFTI
jgi:hypothetical protein